MGADGAKGIRTIKENAGMVLAQEPLTAKFDAMPRSAIATGLVDFVAPAGKLPERIASIFKHSPLLALNNSLLGESSASALEKIITLLRMQTGHDFSQYKRNTLYRRVERRMGIHRIRRIGAYVRFVHENPKELDILVNELLIGVTGFFHDPVAWDRLKLRLAEMIAAPSPVSGRILRAWVAGCSTGEEAYSLAIVFREVLEMVKPHGSLSLQIFATDMQKDAIDKAREGMYGAGIADVVSAGRLARYFVKDDNRYRVGKDLREMIVFAPQNVIMDPPFARLDVVVCRNLLIYLTSERSWQAYCRSHRVCYIRKFMMMRAKSCGRWCFQKRRSRLTAANLTSFVSCRTGLSTMLSTDWR